MEASYVCGYLEFCLISVMMQGVESQTWKESAGMHHTHTPLRVTVLPVSGRYIDGAGHFPYCHFWAHHAALGRCQDH